MIHQRFDIETWKALYPLSRFRQEVVDDVRSSYQKNPASFGQWMPFEQFLSMRILQSDLIVGPLDLARIEQARDLMRQRVAVGHPKPADVFVWALEEPERRDVTKIGGTPYRPRSHPWPQTSTGDPMTFVGQFCFADSCDIVGETPGDILLIFGHPEQEGIWSTADGGLLFEWVHMDETSLVDPAEVPGTEWKIMPCYGQIHRTGDYPDLGSDGGWFGWEMPEFSGLGLLRATKIGGAPWWEQYDPKLPGRFLCVLESVWNFFDSPYPFLNRADVIPWDLPDLGQWNDALMWGDVGRLYVHLDGEKVYWEVQCG